MPWPILLPLLCINVSEPIAITLLFPFAPVMVAGWVVADVVGVWAGMLASIYNFTGFLSNVIWGRAVDRFGPLPILVIALTGQACTLVLFGCSDTLGQAFAARACGGLFGAIGTCTRYCLREVTVKANRGRAFSFMGWSWAVGMIIGPLLGGLLSTPADALPALRGTVLDRFPYLLPCVAATLLNMLGLACLPLLRRLLPSATAAATAHEALVASGVSSTTMGIELPAAASLAVAPAAAPTAAPPAAGRAAAPAATALDDLQLLTPASGASDAPSADTPVAARVADRREPSAARRWLIWLISPVMMMAYTQFLLHLQVATSTSFPSRPSISSHPARASHLVPRFRPSLALPMAGSALRVVHTRPTGVRAYHPDPSLVCAPITHRCRA